MDLTDIMLKKSDIKKDTSFDSIYMTLSNRQINQKRKNSLEQGFIEWWKVRRGRAEHWQWRAKRNVLEWRKCSVSWHRCGLHVSVFVKTHPTIPLRYMHFTVCKCISVKRKKWKKHLLQDWMYYLRSINTSFLCCSLLCILPRSLLPSLTESLLWVFSPCPAPAFLCVLHPCILHSQERREKAVCLLANSPTKPEAPEVSLK